MVYNVTMKEKNIYNVAIIGGGASGLTLAAELCKTQSNIAVFERGERVGRKLSATGNGQGNISNLAFGKEHYFSLSPKGNEIAFSYLEQYGFPSLQEFFETLGLLLAFDERGRVYPAGRQASSITDALRFFIDAQGVTTHTNVKITALEKKDGVFCLRAQTADGERAYYAKTVALCTGGKAAKNLGTDGSAYALAQGFGHTLTPLYPSLVQLKTDTAHSKTLKGIRVQNGVLWAEKDGKEIARVKGDIIFTDYGVSGDAVFQLSAFLTDKAQTGKICLYIDFLPDFSKEKLLLALTEKRASFPKLPDSELLFGVVNNQIGRAIMRRADGDVFRAVELVKGFSLALTGSLGFDYAQVTKGGIPLCEVNKGLESKFCKDLYLAGETLDLDGKCGGYNLQWAYASARAVAAAINGK